MSVDEPRADTTAGISRRLERVEAEQARQAAEIGLIKQEQLHARELNMLHFDAVKTEIRAIGVKVDALGTTITSVASQATDTDRRWAYAAGAAFIVMTAISLFGPTVLRVVFP